MFRDSLDFGFLLEIVVNSLKSRVSRSTILSDASHWIRFVYTPKHSSWPNQIEIWFSILVRRLLRRGSFTSETALRARLLRFIDYFNETLAKPLRWTYAGRPRPLQRLVRLVHARPGPTSLHQIHMLPGQAPPRGNHP